MSSPQMTLLITVTGRDRPGVTSRLFSALAAHELSVLDVEQVVIRGRLVLGVLLSCDTAPDLTAIHRQVPAMAADLGLEAEITAGSAEPALRRGSLHVTRPRCAPTWPASPSSAAWTSRCSAPGCTGGPCAWW